MLGYQNVGRCVIVGRCVTSMKTKDNNCLFGCLEI